MGIKELYKKITINGQDVVVADTGILVVLDRLEKERDALRTDKATLQQMTYSLKDRLEAAEKEYQHVLEVKEIYQRQLNETEDERDALRAKIEQLEQQEPVGCVESLFDEYVIIHNNFDRAAPGYLAPGAQTQTQPQPSVQPKLDEIKIALKRALELGRRETWTGARKHPSREDQREEQQCWNKVWSLLSAQGEWG